MISAQNGIYNYIIKRSYYETFILIGIGIFLDQSNFNCMCENMTES